MESRRHLVSNGHGWKLALFQTFHATKLDRSRRPVLIVPGYGMNSFIYSYHPNGLSLEGYLAEQGFEVFRVDLREQGETVREDGGENYGLDDLALVDLAAAVRTALERTRTAADRLDVLGGSLGGTLMFLYAALEREARLGTLVCLGTPVRWVKVHPLLKLAFSSPALVGRVKFRGTRALAELALPLLARFTPWLLSVYMNPEITDISAAREMTRTVEDPNRFVNQQIARWIKERDLVVRGVNLSTALARLDNPLLCVLGQGDGIVPPETAAFPFHQTGARSKRLLEVGTKTMSMAHADLFVSREAHQRVFRPICDWLLEHEGPSAPQQSKQTLE
jgi:pimeloyl-ACP methyl ester carboxylesterase